MNRIQKEDYQIIAKTMSFYKKISLRLDAIGEDHTKVSSPKIIIMYIIWHWLISNNL